MKKALAMLLVAMMTTSLFAGCSSSSDDMGGEDVIMVNDTALTKNYVDARINQIFQQNQLDSDDAYAGYYKSQIITGLVETELLVQEAKNRGIEVTDDQKDEYRQNLIDQTYGGSESDFQAYLDEYDVSDAMFDRMVEEYLFYNALMDDIEAGITVDAETYYNENSDEFDVADQVQAAHILVADQETAEDIIQQLDDGADFATLAEEYSTDTATASQGGELGYFTADEMVTEFSDAAFALEVGAYTTEPVETSYGYHVILCEDKQEAHHQTFEEVEEDLVETLTQQELQTQYYSLMAELEENATIEYLSDDYNPDLLVQAAEEQLAEESASSSEESTDTTSEEATESTDAEATTDDSAASGESLVDDAE